MLDPIATSGAAAAANRAATEKRLLRFLTCGSVDDGKSTLIGRLLFDCRLVFEDQLAALQADSARFGSNGGKLDLALLVDGLQAEREQGITIDVAYRYFATAKRKFIVADTPGHEQYTRNMVTGASTADLAVLLIDARKGLLPQTRRHSHIVSHLGIRHVVVVVNKMDAIGWDRAQFERIERDYLGFAADLGFKEMLCIPASALEGDNVTRPGVASSWYRGPTLLDYLESVDVESDLASRPFRMPVQWVNRPDSGFRGYCGSIVSGRVRRGERIVVAPSGVAATVARIVTFDGDLTEAVAGQAVTLVLAEEIDVSRGDLFCAAEARPIVAEQFSAHIIWMSEQPMLPGRSYLLQAGTNLVPAQITELKHKISVSTMERIAAKHLDLNEIAVCNLVIDRPIAFDAYADNRDMGAFILIDRISNATVAGGHDRLPTAALLKHPLAGAQDRQGGARRLDGAEALRAVAHWAVRRRQIDHRQSRRAAAASARQPHRAA
jgi:bifunctional enzyme CysN/CysC